MRYAVVENGVVTSVETADEPFADNWIASDAARVGWTYDGETFAEPEPLPTLGKYAIIENDIVTNVALAYEPLADNWFASDTAQIGWVYDGETFTAPTPASPTSTEVNAERDRRMFSTFTFGGVGYDCESASLSRITGAATLAGFAIGAGAPVGNLRWHGGADDFKWIAADNSLTTMDAQTCFAFGQAAADNQSSHIFAGAAIKALDPIPQDFASDESLWP
jgi:hypothetical protein